METIELKDGGLLHYEDAFLPSETADRFFLASRDHGAWEQNVGERINLTLRKILG